MISPRPEFTSFQFSTRALAPGQRVAAWNSAFGQTKARRLLAPQAEPFHLEMKGCALGRAEVMRVAVTVGGAAHRGRDLVADGNDDIVLHIQQRGSRIASQLGRETKVPPGGGIVTTNAEPSTIVLPGAARFVCVAVPRRSLLGLVPRLDDALARPVSPETGILRLLARYLGILDDEAAVANPALRQAVTLHLHDLCSLAIGAGRDVAEIAVGRGLRAARLRAIKACIADRLTDPALSAQSIAGREGISARYVHKLFEHEGTTVSHFVLGQRLQRVHRMLSDSRHAHRRIAELAFEAGFSDVSTFNREFRHRYGMTPSDLRALQL